MKIHAPADIITDYNTGAFRTTYGTLTGCTDINSTISTANGTISGLKSIKIDHSKNDLQLELSAKILLDDYYKLINLDTIEQVFDTVNRSGIVTIDKARINEFDVHSLDTTKNIKCSYTVSNVLDNLALITQNTKYIKEPYRGTGENKHKTGLVFRGKQKTFKERMLFYDKREEMLHDKKYLQSVRNAVGVVRQFEGVLRNECNIATYAKAREYFGTGDMNLLNILKSEQNPNWTIWKRIKGTSCIQTELFTYPEEMAWHELVYYYGLKNICLDCGNDLSIIKDLIKKHVGKNTNISPQVKKVRMIIETLKGQERDNDTSNEIIQEFEELLKSA